MSAALDAVQSIYMQATQHLKKMLDACGDDDDARDQIWDKYYATRKNFDDCVNQTFAENDPVLARLEASAQASATDLSKIDQQLADIGKVLDTLSAAVDYGAKIAAKVISV